MLISLDTNIIIFGLRRSNIYSEKILNELSRFNVVLSSIVEREVFNKLYDEQTKKEFFKLFLNLIDYSVPPDEFIEKYIKKGLKKGDIYIASFLDYHRVDIFISENRHFLTETKIDAFRILSSREFCSEYKLL